MRGSKVRRISINKKTTREVQETINKLKGDQKFEVVLPINERSYFELIMHGCGARVPRATCNSQSKVLH